MKLFKREKFDALTKDCIALSELHKDKLAIGSKSLDSLLGGGVPIGFISHIYGPAGSGKTNLCISAAIECAKQGKKSLFIDTEGGFSIERFKQIAGKTKIEDKIFLKQPLDFEEQAGVVRNLNRMLDSDFGLVVIDSIVSLYRLKLSGERREILELSRELGKELAKLSILAREKNLAVVVCNQVYSSFNKKEEIIPVGGDTLLYWSKITMELRKSKKPGERVATVMKHPSLAEGKQIKFKITGSGLE